MFDYTGRTELLIGKEAAEKLASSSVLLFGAGGVGSYALEALVRAGTGHIGIADGDTVNLSNLNRQLIATRDSIGKQKTEAAKERALSINPEIKIDTYPFMYGEETADRIDFSAYDFILDCVDDTDAKLLIITRARECGKPVLTCMGTGNRTDPWNFTVTDIENTSGDPLARAMRKKLREKRIRGVKVLYSKALPEHRSTDGIISSISFVPSVAGLLAASEAVKYLTGSINY